MKPNVSSSSTFPWRGRRGNLATHHGGENEELGVRIHGGNDGGREKWVWREKREVRGFWRRERK